MLPHYDVFWSPEDKEWCATINLFPSMSSLEDSPMAALQGLISMVAEDDELWRQYGQSYVERKIRWNTGNSKYLANNRAWDVLHNTSTGLYKPN